ncbi:MAG: hypothetical protein WA738_18475 [Candidatus Angelobacter sp.]
MRLLREASAISTSVPRRCRGQTAGAPHGAWRYEDEMGRMRHPINTAFARRQRHQHILPTALPWTNLPVRLTARGVTKMNGQDAPSDKYSFCATPAPSAHLTHGVAVD